MRYVGKMALLGFFAFFSGILVSIVYWAVLFLRFPNTIYRIDEGFIPQNIYVEKGQSVRFVNLSHRAMWPASNTHPNHLAYPAFDPKKPIAAGGSWEFSFTTEGAWKFHDHISPYVTGYVVVGTIGKKALASQCKSPSVEIRENCWDDMFDTAFSTGGISVGLALLETLYKTDSLFREQGCHQHGHRVGEMIYGRYIKGKNIRSVNFPDSMGYCGFGVMHGIFEHLFRDVSDIAYARDTCIYLEKRFSNSVPGIRVNCVHGIGHGFMPEPPPREFYDKPHEMIRRALEVCDDPTVSKTKEESDQCLQGVFNVLVYWMVKDQYGLSYPEKGVFDFCQSLQKPSHQEACTAEFSMHLIKYTGSDLPMLVSRFIDHIDDPRRQKYVLGFAVPSIVEATVSKDNFIALTHECMNLEEHLRSTCVSAIAGGLLAHGVPGEEYKRALVICSSDSLGLFERKDCYRHVLRQLPYHYVRDKRNKICYEFPQEYQKECLDLK
ncbi:hypothetical protein HY947_00325 [Candidatus Gottesmanbacteria bacterium]|nr:hypothetical protein [Candidatus Gottesmanbacteria bacterium]